MQCTSACVCTELRTLSGLLRPVSPSGADMTHERAAAALAEVTAWMGQNQEWIFDKNLTGNCRSHGRPCAVIQPRQADEADGPRPAKMTVGGITCVAYSMVGGRAAEAHSSEAVAQAWFLERKVRMQQDLEDFFVCECVPPWQDKRMLADIERIADVKVLVDNPLLHGDAARRPRKNAFAYAKQRWCWTGPDDIAKDFEARFHRARQLNGDVYFLEKDEDRYESYSERARGQGNAVAKESWQTMPVEDQLSLLLHPGTYQRLLNWTPRAMAWPSNETFLCDIEQNPDGGGKSTGGGACSQRS